MTERHMPDVRVSAERVREIAESVFKPRASDVIPFHFPNVEDVKQAILLALAEERGYVRFVIE